MSWRSPGGRRRPAPLEGPASPRWRRRGPRPGCAGPGSPPGWPSRAQPRSRSRTRSSTWKWRMCVGGCHRLKTRGETCLTPAAAAAATGSIMGLPVAACRSINGWASRGASVATCLSSSPSCRRRWRRPRPGAWCRGRTWRRGASGRGGHRPVDGGACHSEAPAGPHPSLWLAFLLPAVSAWGLAPGSEAPVAAARWRLPRAAGRRNLCRCI